jgi:hypothetical protein
MRYQMRYEMRYEQNNVVMETEQGFLINSENFFTLTDSE